jgi:hypothetical protein
MFEQGKHCVVALTACAVVALGVVASAGAAPASFSGKVCPLLSQKIVASVHVPTNCAQQKTVTSPLGTVWTGVWGTNKFGAARLSVGIQKASAAFLAAAESHKPLGKPIGIGKWSGEQGLANGKTADGITFIVGPYYVVITLNTGPAHPLSSSAPFIKLAKVVAKRL